MVKPGAECVFPGLGARNMLHTYTTCVIRMSLGELHCQGPGDFKITLWVISPLGKAIHKQAGVRAGLKGEEHQTSHPPEKAAGEASELVSANAAGGSCLTPSHPLCSENQQGEAWILPPCSP